MIIRFLARLPLLLTALFVLPFLLTMVNESLGLPILNLFPPYTGLTLIMIGLVIFIHCTYLHFKIGRTSPDPFSRHTKLIKVGLYRYSRNPMYLGYLLILLGELLLWGHLILSGYFLGAIIFFQFIYIPHEEKKLKKEMGREYRLYLKKVPRWLDLSIFNLLN